MKNGLDNNEKEIDWGKKHIIKIGSETKFLDEIENEKEYWRPAIRSWLTTIFQSEHLSLLIGSGLTKAVMDISNLKYQTMKRIEFENYKEEIREFSDITAKNMDRGVANFEDDLRTAFSLLQGLQIIKDKNAEILRNEINSKLSIFINGLSNIETNFLCNGDRSLKALSYLKSFLISSASRIATRDRLHIFTTNYDRFIEYGCDLAGIIILDNFMGKVHPVFRNTKLELDYHYNPPGIRGEPRYVEGVIRYTKLHGSVDWRFENKRIIKKSINFGEQSDKLKVFENDAECVVIYPNSLKGIEIAFYPYSELFRDFAASICRPNSSILIYGYGFGDTHINHILKDMLNIPSTHLVIISYDSSFGKINNFLQDCNMAQITLLIGNYFGDLEILVDNYLPKPAMDKLIERMQMNSENKV